MSSVVIQQTKKIFYFYNKTFEQCYFPFGINFLILEFQWSECNPSCKLNKPCALIKPRILLTFLCTSVVLFMKLVVALFIFIIVELLSWMLLDVSLKTKILAKWAPELLPQNTKLFSK